MIRGKKAASDPDTLRRLYATMSRIRAFEELCTDLWEQGRISGELHSSIGEEAVAAGIVDHLGPADALALDHRGTGPLVARGVELEPLLYEMLGDERGLGNGVGGHMHLMSRDHVAAADGIVGATGPLACGFALSAKRAGDGGVAVAFFGEGAANQGMLMESFNLAVAWRLPVLFVCKDNRWSISTRSSWVTGGKLDRRASAFGLATATADGTDVADVWSSARRLLTRARTGKPGFLRVRVSRPSGHQLDDVFLRLVKEPLEQAQLIAAPLVVDAARAGADRRKGLRGLAMLARQVATLAAGRVVQRDPLRHTRDRLPANIADRLDEEAAALTRRTAEAVLGRQ